MRHIQLQSLVDRRQRRKQASLRSLRRRTGRLAVGCGAGLLLALFGLLLALGLGYVSLVDGLPSLALLPELLDPDEGSLMQPTRLYDRSGSVLLYSLENPGVARRYVYMDPAQPEHFSPELIRVTVGAINPDYWQSWGFSLADLTDPQPVSIPERLVDDLLLWREPRGLRRSLRMRLLAAQVVARYGHVQVLEWYLNSAPFGHLAYGADSAAQLYLDKTAQEVDLPDAALLAAAIQSPGLNPLDAPEAALERQRSVLELLRARGVIGSEEYARAAGAQARLARTAGRAAQPAAAFSRLVVERLAAQFDRQRLERGGLRVITTLDYPLQLEMSCMTRTQLIHLTGKPGQARLPDGSECQSAQLLPALPADTPVLPESTEASAVILHPKTGQVLALLGDSTIDGEAASLTPRAPGSLLTPIVAMAGFARGMGPATLTWDIPSSLPDGSANLQNPDQLFHGPVRLRTALANDYLAGQAQILTQLSPMNVWRQAGALGLSDLTMQTSGSTDLLFGEGAVSPLEMAQAYSVFANLGLRTGQRVSPGGELLPAVVLYVIEQDGTVWYDGQQNESQAVVSEQIAYLVHDVLSDAPARWPSLGYPNPLEISRPAGAKVGQVQDGSQVWSVGYTPQRVGLFWLGAQQKDGVTRIDPRLAAGMWHAAMQFAHRDLPVEDWTQPAGIAQVEVCDPSGQLPTENCPEIVKELFLAGSEPNAPDGLYKVFQLNRETGRLATVFTPPALVEEKLFMVVPAQASEWAQVAGLPVPPEDYDAIQPPDPSANARINAPGQFAFLRGQVRVEGTADGEDLRFYQLQVGKGLNPQTWLQVGPDGEKPVKNGTLGIWDTEGGEEGLYAVRLLVIKQDQTVETDTIQVTVDNTSPAARIPYPSEGQVFQLPGDREIILQASVEDALGIDHVAWWIDGKKAGERADEPYVLPWKATEGEHVLEIRAVDLAGNETVSDAVRFTVAR